MSNPSSPISCPIGVYTKVATNIIGVNFLWKMIASADYHYTYRLTGQAAPTLFSEAVLFFRDDNGSWNVQELTYKEEVDVYLWCTKTAGQVRLDA